MLCDEFSSGLDGLESSGKCAPALRRKQSKKDDDNKSSYECKTKWGSSNSKYSLFRSNPEIQPLKRNVIEPVKEPLFSTETFDNFPGLHPHMVANLRQTLDVTKVTAVQAKTIPAIQSGKDLLVRSQTGSGKTLAYAIPIVESLHSIRPKLTRKDGLRAVIILPTRELALQTYEFVSKLVKPFNWIVPGILVGGEKKKSEKARLRKGITILISTPGRLLDHAKTTKCVSFSSVNWLIIDEADRLLELGYDTSITSIIEIIESQQSSAQRQNILLSATLTSGVEKLAGLSLKNPHHIDVSSDNDSTDKNVLIMPDSLRQQYLVSPAKLRLVSLAALILQICDNSERKMKALVFMATQAMVDYHTELLATVLENLNFYKLHGNMTQVERVDVFKSYRAADNGILLCSDVASRGLDLPHVDWIIQYTAPITAEDYVHRVGRTARVGNVGNALLFVAPHEIHFISKLHNHRIAITEKKIDDLLKNLVALDFDDTRLSNVQAASNTLQVRFETAVFDQTNLHNLGCEAYKSWVRFYATYPKEVREIFNFKELHLGHYAKAFALRDAPKTISGIGRPSYKRNSKNNDRQEKNSTNEKRIIFKGRKFSEFDDGLQSKKRKVEHDI